MTEKEKFKLPSVVQISYYEYRQIVRDSFIQFKIKSGYLDFPWIESLKITSD